MPTGDLEQPAVSALHRLRQHWFAPSRPLAVDDEPQWLPAADPDASQPIAGDLESAPAPAGKT